MARSKAAPVLLGAILAAMPLTIEAADGPVHLWAKFDPPAVAHNWLPGNREKLLAELAKQANEAYWVNDRFRATVNRPAPASYQVVLEFTDHGGGKAHVHLRQLPPMPPGAPLGEATVNWNLLTGFKPDHALIGRQVKTGLFLNPGTASKLSQFLQSVPDAGGHLPSDSGGPSYPAKPTPFAFELLLPSVTGADGVFYDVKTAIVTPTAPAIPPRYEMEIEGSNRIAARHMLPVEGQLWRAVVNRRIDDGHLNTSRKLAVCFKVRDAAPAGGMPSVRFDCRTGGCQIDPGGTDAGTFDACPTRETFGGGSWSLIAKAFADEAKPVWNVPTAAALEGQLADPESRVAGQGFTVFRVQSDDKLAIDADSVVYSLTAGGKPVRVGGFDPEEIPVSILPDGKLWLEFALQNLDFSGTDMGCDILELDLAFLKAGQPVGQSVRIKRSYIALRNAERTIHTTPVGKLSWVGKYRQGPKREEVAVEAFIATSAFAVDGVIAADRERLGERLTQVREARRKTILDLKDWFDRGGKRPAKPFTVRFKGRERPLTLVIRPPLSQRPIKNGKVRMAYGLAAAVKLEPSHQVQFTFKEDDVRRIRERILEYRNEKSKNKAGKMVPTRRAKNLVGWFDRLNKKDKLPGYPVVSQFENRRGDLRAHPGYD